MDAFPEGWSPCPRSHGFSSLSGPYWERREDGGWVRAFRVEARHLNPEGVVHGGVLTAFADYACYRAIGDELSHEVRFATITLTCNFLAAGKEGGVIQARAAITRRTRSVIFAQGEIADAERPLMTMSGVWKLLGG